MKKSYRLDSWDYSGRSTYFITVCTKDRGNYFGEIENGVFTPTPLGEEVIRQWLSTPTLRPFMNIALDEFTLMPNHFHGIIGIGRNLMNRPLDYLIKENMTEAGAHIDSCYQEEGSEPIMPRALFGISPNTYGPQSNNLGSIMRGFKSAVTNFARINKILFDWQRSYHDIIIRDERALINIRRYIKNNVKTWERDRIRKRRKRL